MTENLFSGWGELRPSEKTAHYYVAGTSLCNKVGFFRGELSADEPADQCPTCARRKDLLAAMPSKKAPTTTLKPAAKPRASRKKN